MADGESANLGDELCSLPTEKVGSTLGNGKTSRPAVPYVPQDREPLGPKYKNINLNYLCNSTEVGQKRNQ